MCPTPQCPKDDFLLSYNGEGGWECALCGATFPERFFNEVRYHPRPAIKQQIQRRLHEDEYAASLGGPPLGRER